MDEIDLSLIYGKDNTQRIVCVEVESNGTVTIFKEELDGKIVTETRNFKPYILFTQPKHKSFQRLKNNQHYKYLYQAPNLDKYESILQKSYYNKWDVFTTRDLKEQFLIYSGMTYFKGMKISEVSTLKFDLEHSFGIGKDLNPNGKLFVISNVFRKNGKVIKKLFSLDDFNNERSMIEAWCEWVRTVDPSIIGGHNIFMHDFQVLKYVSEREGAKLLLGRDKSRIQFNSRVSKFRKDMSQHYDYYNCQIYGREIIDGFFLSIKYDIKRDFESYALKQIIKQLGLEKKDRTFIDASKIREEWNDLEKRKKIKAYALDDTEDSFKVFDLMAPMFFYYTQAMPRSFQQIINTAPGSQINGMMVRAYLQKGYSIPKHNNKEEFEGAISFAKPGIHKNIARFDVASLYPSIMLQYRVYDKNKDPYALSLKILEYVTNDRLSDKKRAKETGDKHYEHLSDSKKPIINSFYGFMAALLNYNYPKGAAIVTKYGRDILTKVIELLEEMGYIIIGGDTDGLAFQKPKGKAFEPGEIERTLERVNSQMDERIRWELDDPLNPVVRRQINVKTKNYIIHKPKAKDKKKRLIIKGSGLKATNKEKALQQFTKDIIDLLLFDKMDQVIFLYLKYSKDILNLKDISTWCLKKTITKAVMKPERTTEERVQKAILDIDFQEGDKIYMFYETDDTLSLQQNFKGEYSKKRLLKKLYATLKVFKNIIDISLFPDFTIKKNLTLLSDVPQIEIKKV